MTQVSKNRTPKKERKNNYFLTTFLAVFWPGHNPSYKNVKIWQKTPYFIGPLAASWRAVFPGIGKCPGHNNGAKMAVYGLLKAYKKPRPNPGQGMKKPGHLAPVVIRLCIHTMQ